MNNIAGAASTFKKAATPECIEYAKATLRNAKALAAALLAEGVTLVTGGTDNHLLVIDTVTSFGLDGRVAEEALDSIGITTNKQVIQTIRVHPCVQVGCASARQPAPRAGCARTIWGESRNG